MATKQPIQISIPKPCHEDWNKMTPAEQGRFCDSCQKCVIDFTKYTDRELHDFFSKHSGERICGRYNITQLNRAIHAPARKQPSFYKYVAGIGLSLILSQLPDQQAFAKAPYSCISPEPQKDGNKTTYTIKGNVRDNNHDAVTDAAVTAWMNDEAIATTFTDAKGNYVLKLPKKGSYTIKCTAFQHQDVSILANVPEQTIINIYVYNTPQREFEIMGGPMIEPVTLTGDTIIEKPAQKVGTLKKVEIPKLKKMK